MNCPYCNKRHNKFPRLCYSMAKDDYSHVIIAKLASNGNSQQQDWAKEAENNWNKMKDYVNLKFPNEIPFK